jgi:hypothetical protein
MELPINENELEIIIEKLKTSNPQLYAKLWSYKVNCRKKDKIDGFS